jgi:hypothetical protein
LRLRLSVSAIAWSLNFAGGRAGYVAVVVGAGSFDANGEGSSSGIASRWPAAAASMLHSSGEAFGFSVRKISSSTS